MTRLDARRVGRRLLGDNSPLVIPAYRRLVAAHMTNVLGYWLYLTAMLTTVTGRLGGDAGDTSRLTALATLPLIVFAPFTGLAIDRFGPRRALRIAYFGAGVVLAGAATADSVAGFSIAAICLAACVSLLRPAVFGLLGRLVPDAQLSQGNGLLFASAEAAIVIGPLLAFTLIHFVNSDAAFIGGGLTLVVAGMLLGRVPNVAPLVTTVGAGWRDRAAELVAGVRAIAADRPSTVALLVVMTLFGYLGVLFSLEPVLIVNELGARHGDLGLIYAAAGAGSAVSTATLARLAPPPRPLPRVALALATLGALTIGYSTSPTLLVAAGWSVLVGLAFGWVLSPSATVVQRRAPSVVIGRVMASFTIVQVGAQGLAALVVGAVAGSSVRPSLAVTGAACVAVGITVFLGTRGRDEPPPAPGSPAARHDASHVVAGAEMRTATPSEPAVVEG
ncbi:MAG: MFS transporter [Mycobacteriales bacterium]|nr:MFS transporter [Frankia sp.]